MQAGRPFIEARGLSTVVTLDTAFSKQRGVTTNTVPSPANAAVPRQNGPTDNSN